MIVGTIVCGFGISSAFLTFIIKAFVNPNNIKPDIYGYYPEEVYNRVPDYFIFAIYCFGSLAVLSFILIRPYTEAKVENLDIEKNGNLEEENIDIEDIFIDENEKNKIDEKAESINDEKIIKSNVRTVKLRKAIFSKQNIYLFFLGFTNYCKYFFIRFSYLFYKYI